MEQAFDIPSSDSWNLGWWDVGDVQRAARLVSLPHLKAHKHEQMILGEPLTRMFAAGLIGCRPQLVKGRPVSWMVQITPFGQAVREYLQRQDRVYIGSYVVSNKPISKKYSWTEHPSRESAARDAHSSREARRMGRHTRRLYIVNLYRKVA